MKTNINTMKTAVKFYKEEEGTILAVFPHNSEGHGQVECYSHIGQHSVCSIAYYLGLEKANRSEYSSLKAELESDPYNYSFRVV